jgi:hypothetical protein
MGENKGYLAIGEEAIRGTKEASTVGFIPLNELAIPEPEFNDIGRDEWRGEEQVKGKQATLRKDRRWTAEFSMPIFSEAGSTVGMVGTTFKHYFGNVTSVQNGATGQYDHSFSGVADPFDTANLGTKALTYNLNRNKGTVMTNYPFVGGRVSGLTFEQEAGDSLNCSVSMMGTIKAADTAEIGSPTYAAENLRCDFNNLNMYTGTITPTGSAPDYTDFNVGSATAVCPDSVTVTFENGMEDKIELCGDDFPNKTTMGKFTGTLSMTLDLADPSSGFSSDDEYDNWFSDPNTTNREFLLKWDTGTQAGTGDNHSLYIHLPKCVLTSGVPEYDLERDPTITLEYEFEYDSTDLYAYFILLKNTATSV